MTGWFTAVPSCEVCGIAPAALNIAGALLCVACWTAGNRFAEAWMSDLQAAGEDVAYATRIVDPPRHPVRLAEASHG